MGVAAALSLPMQWIAGAGRIQDPVERGGRIHGATVAGSTEARAGQGVLVADGAAVAGGMAAGAVAALLKGHGDATLERRAVRGAKGFVVADLA